MIDWIVCGLMLALAGSLAGLVWVARRAITRAAVPSTDVPGHRVAVIVPVAGAGESMEASVLSLLRQIHPGSEVVFVLRDPLDPAAAVVQSAIRGQAAATCVFAGAATACGQKNHNLLAGVSTVEGRADVLVFADARHLFPAGWLERLVAPIVGGDGEVTSGYHAVRPTNGGLVPWIYAVCVEMMHALQNAPGLSQPWGGAMAISRRAFERLKVADTWRISVVDDVSLARVLRVHGVRVRTVPSVLLETSVARLSLRDLLKWLVRQLQYVRFIMPGTWAVMGGWCLLQVVAFGAAAVLVMTCAVDLSPALLGAVSALYLAVLAVVLLELRLVHPLPCRPVRWLVAGMGFLVVVGVALAMASLGREIRWRGICYQVGDRGRVLAIRQTIVNG